MPFGVQNQTQRNTSNKNNNSNNNISLLAQTLFNPQNQLVFDQTSIQHNQIADTTTTAVTMNDYSTAKAAMTTSTTATSSSSNVASAPEAIILQTNGTPVSEEILAQLQEQVGDTKQIYILNTEDDDNNVQYLIVDKDADISAILQDPSIFQTAANNTAVGIVQQPVQQQPQQQQQYIIVQNNPISVEQIINETSTNVITQQQQQQQQQQHISHHQQQHTNYSNNNNNNTINKLQNNHYNSKNINSYNSQMQSISNVEESVQRVSVPPPKRKTFEFQLDNRKNSYQDAFLKYLAGEKQPSLDIIAEHITRKPKETLFNYSALMGKKNLNQSNTSGQNATTTTQPIIATGGVNSNTDKENYYNASRRENLTTQVSTNTTTTTTNSTTQAANINGTNEYRNSYKDHYDHQGVRLNPAILKSLPTEHQQTLMHQNQQSQVNRNSSSVIISQQQQQQQQNHVDANKINDVTQLLNYPQNDLMGQNGADSIDLELLAKESALLSAKAVSNTLSDHTYKIKPHQIATGQPQLPLPQQVTESQQLTKPQDSTSSTTTQQQVQQQQQSRKRAKANTIANSTSNPTTTTATDSSGDEDKLKRKIRKPNEQQTPNKLNGTMDTNGQMDVTKEVSIEDEVTFAHGEFLIHKSTFSDLENYDIWCVRDDGYLQKYEPVYLSTGERCHQSADVLAQYTPDKNEFVLVKVEEKGKTEQNNIVVCVLNEFEPKNLNYFQQQIKQQQLQQQQLQLQVQQQQQQEVQVNNKNILNYDDLKPTFDVFLQILLSQSLNSEFLCKIKEIQDDYFKPALEVIDTIFNEKYLLINEYAKFNDIYKKCLDDKPKLFLDELKDKSQNISCQALREGENLEISEYIAKLIGVPYNAETLQLFDDKDAKDQEFLISARASKLSEIYHSVKHLKYNFYEMCTQKIEQVKSHWDENNAAADILTICLADNQWLLEVFQRFKKVLVDIDQSFSETTSNLTNVNEN